MRFAATALLLAGGKSTRFGSNKANIMYEGQTLLDRLLKLVTSCFDEVLLSVAKETKYYTPGVKQLLDEKEGFGPIEGLRMGLINAKYDALLAIGCDMPFVSTDAFALLLEKQKGFDAAVPFDGKNFEPLLAVYGRSCLPAIDKVLSQNRRSILNVYPYININRVDYDGDGAILNKHILHNINYPGDIDYLSKQ